MEGNNKKKNKYYYKYHNNHNNHCKYYNHNNKKNYYYKKNKNHDKKQNVVENQQVVENQIVIENNQINNNNLLNNSFEQQEQIMEQKPKIVQVIKENVDDYEELDFRPIKKGEKEYDDIPGKIGFFKYAIGFFILVIVMFGVSYSFFTYRKEDTRQADIATGDVYVALQDETVSMTMNKMYPRTPEEARSRSDNYIDFTVKYKNTSTTTPINYQIKIIDGEDISGKTRINPKYLMADLQEKINGEYVFKQEAVNLDEFNFEDVVPINTTSEITKEYRLRIWVSDEIIISDTEPNATFTQNEFKNLFGTINVSIKSFDKEPTIYAYEKVRKNIETIGAINENFELWKDTADNVEYLSGDYSGVDMNYVWYSGKLWRITQIYPDGRMKMVTQDVITTIAFNAAGLTEFYTDENNKSYMYQWLNEDFYDTLYHADEFIDNATWNFSADSNTTPVRPETLSTQKTTTAKVGLLNAYEYYNSYRGSTAMLGYLNISYYWWTLTQFDNTYIRILNTGGALDKYTPKQNAAGVRPAVVLKSTIEFTGDGTKTNPYKIVGDKDTGRPSSYINTRLSGEYVKLKNGNNEQLFRIIGVEDNKTKIIAMDYADQSRRKYFSSASGPQGVVWGSGTTTGTDTWYTYLNNTYYPNLESTYGNLFDSGLYYLGATMDDNYKSVICANVTNESTKECEKTTDVGTFDIGLPLYGEMFAAQQSNGVTYSINMWLMNRATGTSIVWYSNAYGHTYGNSPASYGGARPTVFLKPLVIIVSGTGTYDDPYVVGL